MYTGDRFVGHLLCAFCHTKYIYFRVDLVKARDLIAQRPCLQVFFFRMGVVFRLNFYSRIQCISVSIFGVG